MLKNDEIADALAEAQAAQSERTQVDADYVVTELVALIDAAATPSAAKVTALALLSKHTGGFVDRQQAEQHTLIRFTPAMGGVHAEDD